MDINEMNELQQINCMEFEDPWLIRDINNPSKEVQLAAVRTNPYVIQEIQDPCYIVQKAAITKNMEVAKFIKNLDPDIQVLMANNNYYFALINENCLTKEAIVMNREENEMQAKQKYTHSMRHIQERYKKRIQKLEERMRNEQEHSD